MAFTLQESPGAPSAAALPVTIPVGTRVQSVPGPDETPQSFETVAEAAARVEWNAIPVQTTHAWTPVLGDKSLYLAGVATQLQPGDALLIVGEERRNNAANARWDIRLVTAVEPDAAGQRTRVSWANGLGSVAPLRFPAAAGATVYAFRSRAALFGHGAPDPRLMTIAAGSPLEAITEGTGSALTWADFEIQGAAIDLDAAYPKVVPGSWVALVSNESAAHPSGFRGAVALYNASAVSFPSRTDYGLSGKVTRIAPDTVAAALDPFRNRLRENLVLAQSEALAVAETPLAFPLYGETLALGRIVAGLEAGRTLAVSGKRARIRLRRGQPDATLQLASGAAAVLHEGGSLRLAGVPEVKFGAAWLALPPVLFGLLVDRALGVLRLTLLDAHGEQGTLTIAAAAIEHAAAEDADETVSEIAFVGTLPDAVTPGPDRTTLKLAAALTHCYDRPTARVNANVAPATHGETVNEIVGSGDARVPNAAYLLKQLPVTYVSAATPSGRASTLTLRANDLAWQEVPSLYARGPAERVFETVARRCRTHHRALRRRHRGRAAAVRRPQPPCDVSQGTRPRRERRRGPPHQPAVASPRRRRGDQSGSGDRRRGRRDDRQGACERARHRADARTRGVDPRLPRFRARLRRHRQGPRAVGAGRARTRRVRHRRRRARRGGAADERHVSQPPRGAAATTAIRSCRSRSRTTSMRASGRGSRSRSHRMRTPPSCCRRSKRGCARRSDSTHGSSGRACRSTRSARLRRR